MPRYNTTANNLSSLGRNGDTMLMHVNPEEVAGLAAILGKEPTVNPDTGLPEAFGWTNLISSALESLMGGGVGNAIYEPLKEWGTDAAKEVFSDPETVKSVGESLGIVGSGVGGGLTGALIGAGTAGITGQDVGYGALGGFGAGALSGGYAGLEQDDALSQITRPTTMQQPAGYQPNATTTTATDPLSIGPQAWNQAAGSANIGTMGSSTPLNADLNASRNYADLGASSLNTPSVNTSNLQSVGEDTIQPLASPSEATPDYFSLKNLKNKDNWKVWAQSMMASNALKDEYYNAQSAEEYQKKQRDKMMAQFTREQDYQERLNQLNQPYKYYSDGGDVAVTKEPRAMVGQQIAPNGIPVTMRVPERAIDDIQDAGGISSLFAAGGYINTGAFDPDRAYPQSMIPKAASYPGAAPIRNQVVGSPYDSNYGDGGFIDGEGDGMSDDIDATIDDVEPVKVADGEFIIPKDIVDALGVDALDSMLKRVRMAAHGSDKQIAQDAAKQAFMQSIK